MITFAVFHYDMSAALQRRFIPHCGGETFDFLGMADLALRSAARFHPGCRKVVLTDLSSDVSRLPRDVEVVRYPLNPDRANFDRAAAQLDFLLRHDYASHVVLLDSDVLVNNELESLFDHAFDVGLTYRRMAATPVNAGVVAIHANGREGAVAFFGRMVQILRADYVEEPGWLWGSDQYGLIEAVGREAFQVRTEDRLRTADAVSIQLWPCETHNYSPIARWRVILSRDPARKLFHFKGDLKRLMRPYWTMHLDRDQTAASRWMLRFRVAARAAREIAALRARRLRDSVF